MLRNVYQRKNALIRRPGRVRNHVLPWGLLTWSGPLQTSGLEGFAQGSPCTMIVPVRLCLRAARLASCSAEAVAARNRIRAAW